jgi:hypothetical protein
MWNAWSASGSRGSSHGTPGTSDGSVSISTRVPASSASAFIHTRVAPRPAKTRSNSSRPTVASNASASRAIADAGSAGNSA